MKDKEQDVFAQAAAQMHKAFPPIVQTVTQAKADLERLYPKGGDGKSTTVKMQTTTGEDVQMVLAENAGSGKGKSFLPQLSGFDPLTVARTESVFMLQLLEQASGVTLGDEQKQTFLAVLSDLPEGATVLDLLDAILGVPPEQYEPLAPLFKALQKMQEEGVHAGLFTQHADK